MMLNRSAVKMRARRTRGAARRARELEWDHTDGSDRLIVAIVLRLDLPLVTADRAIAQWGGVEVIW
jgi:PIN domain nuclease of toxin-antitoxin system